MTPFVFVCLRAQSAHLFPHNMSLSFLCFSLETLSGSVAVIRCDMCSFVSVLVGNSAWHHCLELLIVNDFGASEAWHFDSCLCGKQLRRTVDTAHAEESNKTILVCHGANKQSSVDPSNYVLEEL